MSPAFFQKYGLRDEHEQHSQLSDDGLWSSISPSPWKDPNFFNNNELLSLAREHYPRARRQSGPRGKGYINPSGR